MSDGPFPWNDPRSDPLEEMAALSEQSRTSIFPRSKFVMPPGISRVLDERYGRQWRDGVDRDAWIIQDEEERDE